MEGRKRGSMKRGKGELDIGLLLGVESTVYGYYYYYYYYYYYDYYDYYPMIVASSPNNFLHHATNTTTITTTNLLLVNPPCGILLQLLKSIRGVSKVEVSRGGEYGIIRAIEPLALIVVSQ